MGILISLSFSLFASMPEVLRIRKEGCIFFAGSWMSVGDFGSGAEVTKV